jgi:Protein of unknown function (DUF4065)
MKLHFDEAKATAVAAFILKLRGGTMHYIKLVKLMYLVDRASLVRWGGIVTTDHHVSMDNGPVGSCVLNLITKDVPKPVWEKHISPPFGEDEISLLKEATTDRLSRAEEKLIREIYGQFGHQNRWDVVAYTHKLPEYKDPHGSSIPIHPREILRAEGESEQEIKATLKELRVVDAAEDAVPSAR